MIANNCIFITNKYNVYNIMTCIFIFTRDLRTHDNTGLNYAFKTYKNVIPLFFLTKTQISDSNKYKSDNAINFMKSCLVAIKDHVNIFYTATNGEDILRKLIRKYNVSAILINRDYTPFAIKREQDLERLCKKINIEFHSFHDYLLYSDLIINTGSKEPYKKFTSFYNKVNVLKVRRPSTETGKIIKLKDPNLINNAQLGSKKVDEYIFTKSNLDFIKNYEKQKDFVDIQTTKLSVYLKFGVISIRELYYKTKSSTEFTRSLTWRDFYYNYYYANPDILINGDYYIKWKSININTLNKWKHGETGFPIIDAGMRELNQTGFMHNRIRMLVASFLSKDLQINWKEGEKYFSQKLNDIDRIINAGNWQNVVSVAKHSQPYFRVLNPWLQSKKYDKNCIYIKKWIPELKNVDNKIIHKWYIYHVEYSKIKYPKPMIDHEIAKERYIASHNI
jgi:deoxyribodipyrimidine photo-lyase